MNRDYAAEVAAMDAEVKGLAAQIDALRVRYQLRCIDLGELQEEADDAAAWEAASKTRRAAVVALPADVLALFRDGGWTRWPAAGVQRGRMLELRLIRKVDGRHQLTALGKAARAYARRGAEWCGMSPGQLFGGAR